MIDAADGRPRFALCERAHETEVEEAAGVAKAAAVAGAGAGGGGRADRRQRRIARQAEQRAKQRAKQEEAAGEQGTAVLSGSAAWHELVRWGCTS